MTCPDFEGAIIGFCNPLLDITATVDEAFLQKYSLDANNAILAGPEHLPLYEELVSEYSVEYNAGGAGQNTMRCAQWLLPPNSTIYVGCVGSDEFGNRLRSVATGDGLQVEYLVDEKAPTGTCACLITGRNRSLVANLGAANNYQSSHIESAHMTEILGRARIIYISGYFLTVSPATIMHVAKKARAEGKLVTLNLSAPFICEFFRTPLMEVLPYVDVVFGNESEVAAFGKDLSIGSTDATQDAKTHLIAIGKYIQEDIPKQTLTGARQVVITQGADPTLIVDFSGKVREFAVAPLPTESIVDTTGAGDCFVGGFLSQLLKDKPLEDCVEAGHFAAGVIIRRSGVTFPALPESLPF